jgi:predicted nuclease of predicted toxin-antitoxin system
VRIRFLIDEDLPPRIKAMLLRQDPTIDVLRVGDSGAPPHGTKDPDILRYVALEQRLLITNNRRTMGIHAAALLAMGTQHWGILRCRPDAVLREVAEDLYLLWGASEAEEWIGRVEWVPL